MSTFEEIARAAAHESAQNAEQERAKREERERLAKLHAEAEEEAMNQHVIPLLREAQKALDHQKIRSSLDLDRNAPTMAKELVIGHANTPEAARKQATLRVQRAGGQYAIVVTSSNGGPKEWTADSDDLRETMGLAFQDGLNRWHRLDGYF